MKKKQYTIFQSFQSFLDFLNKLVVVNLIVIIPYEIIVLLLWKFALLSGKVYWGFALWGSFLLGGICCWYVLCKFRQQNSLS